MAKVKKDEKRMEELNRELRGYIAQIESLRAEIAAIDESVAEYRNVAATLKNLKDLGEGKNIFLPVGSVAQIEAKLEKPEKVLMTLGSRISVELSYDEALKQIEKDIAALIVLREALERAVAEAYQKVEELVEKVRELGHEEAGANEK